MYFWLTAVFKTILKITENGKEQTALLLFGELNGTKLNQAKSSAEQKMIDCQISGNYSVNVLNNSHLILIKKSIF